MIEITDLRCERNEHVLFQKVNILLNPGAALQIVGPNGIGKSTLLRAVANRLPPGTVCYVGHKNNLHPALTVAENLSFLQALQSGSNANDFDNYILPALEYFCMQRFADKSSAELSAGQLQRVSLARLCLTTAKVWLLDEPAANLDAAAQQLLLCLCTQHLRNNGSIICATHNIFEFPAVNSSIIRLQEYA